MKVVSLSKDAHHRFSKIVCDSLSFSEGRGVDGDAHSGRSVQHRSRVKIDPNQANLRQVHLLQAELLSELQQRGFQVEPGAMAENVLTSGIDLLALPSNTVLKLGDEVVLRLTGLRNPCAQLDKYQQGLKKAVFDFDAQGNLVRKAGVMAVVLKSGLVRVGDPIVIEYPAQPFEALEPV